TGSPGPGTAALTATATTAAAGVCRAAATPTRSPGTDPPRPHARSTAASDPEPPRLPPGRRPARPRRRGRRAALPRRGGGELLPRLPPRVGEAGRDRGQGVPRHDVSSPRREPADGEGWPAPVRHPAR